MDEPALTLAVMLHPDWWTGERMFVAAMCLYLAVSMLRSAWRD